MSESRPVIDLTERMGIKNMIIYKIVHFDSKNVKITMLALTNKPMANGPQAVYLKSQLLPLDCENYLLLRIYIFSTYR